MQKFTKNVSPCYCICGMWVEYAPTQNIGGYFSASSNSIGVDDLTHIKYGVIALLLFGMVIALTGSVMADGRVSQTPEIQVVSTATFIDAIGTVSETDSLAWVLTNDPAARVLFHLHLAVVFRMLHQLELLIKVMTSIFA